MNLDLYSMAFGFMAGWFWSLFVIVFVGRLWKKGGTE